MDDSLELNESELASHYDLIDVSNSDVDIEEAISATIEGDNADISQMVECQHSVILQSLCALCGQDLTL
jgi:hypothetical protein